MRFSGRSKPKWLELSSINLQRRRNKQRELYHGSQTPMPMPKITWPLALSAWR
ncbi:hypothetical protein PGT21_034599 [Puccinia graminis f. sp. tritici]|uniref:Uncharacterized protein n=1 Tax=Puccinia graminis f. sp. tritici TaxID=56615 RepID=A0A5B0RJR5_PUCGR|nr:hypothetical protein PGT21_034233 [Puccinia graminis f. sp. tritici]KAA1101984.1 hypothetical protein PGT21_034599 [Puccinia graminis f. sp. tritici]KAA1125639.1 hypothetical protein PGTUg99_015607 [Puccinia graminis f. sp. tritici]